MSISQFKNFVESLKTAAARDTITSWDVRLKGSSADFFSGYHKRMPWTKHDLLESFRNGQGRLADPSEFNDILDLLDGTWPADSARPTRRPFDAFFRLRLASEPSDYDIQLSSDEVVKRARAKVAELGVDPLEVTVHSSTYDFIRKDIVEAVCPFLHLWAIRQTSVLRRLVSIAAFPSSGPPDKELTVGRLSSHFRSTDWVLIDEVSHG